MAFVVTPNTTIDVWLPGHAPPEAPSIIGADVQQLKPYIEWSGEIDAPEWRNFIYRFVSADSELSDNIGAFVSPSEALVIFRFSAFSVDHTFIMTGMQVVLDGGELNYMYFTAVPRLA